MEDHLDDEPTTDQPTDYDKDVDDNSTIDVEAEDLLAKLPR